MSETPSPVIVWFRQDLRLADNPALAAAAASGAPVLPLFILDETPGVRPLGGAAKWWLERSLAALGSALDASGARLLLRRGAAGDVLSAVARQSGARTVLWNRLYDAGSVARDTAVKARLTDEGLTCASHNAALLNEPWTIKTGAGEPFKVFTPYWRSARESALSAEPLPSAASLRPARSGLASDALADWGLYLGQPDWAAGFGDWTPGEAGAAARLDAFVESALDDYASSRDRPDRLGTSRLSPHLHFGEIGPRQVLARVMAAAAAGDVSHAQADKLAAELGWREFNHQLLFHRPEMARHSFNAAFDAFPWRDDPEGLRAWRQGRTGYPIVDAGMRELWSTGWMHNRVRMVVASFLTKHQLIDWRHGEAWFWDTLLDADIANNIANWQWVAGSGADAAPYFRIFNPTLQGERFDPKGDYVRRWVPELARLPASAIHSPWRLGDTSLADAGVVLGRSYPHPVVDHQMARTRALAAYRELQG